ncbi:MAG: hypothetical protein JO339_09735 [Alphaproteobacteria bacterium]|nr:hypothetical protein [Alphaproteobacteria bacterium]
MRTANRSISSASTSISRDPDWGVVAIRAEAQLREGQAHLEQLLHAMKTNAHAPPGVPSAKPGDAAPTSLMMQGPGHVRFPTFDDDAIHQRVKSRGPLPTADRDGSEPSVAMRMGGKMGAPELAAGHGGRRGGATLDLRQASLEWAKLVLMDFVEPPN